MPQNFSKTVSSVRPSLTVSLNAKTLELIKSGKDVLNFTVGEPDFPTPEPVIEATVTALKAGKTKYGPAGGSLPLRNAIAAKIAKENRIDYKADDIVVGIGAKEILFHCFLSLLDHGDKVILFPPFWLSYADQVKACGGEPIYCAPADALKPDVIDFVQLEKLWNDHSPKVIVLNSPNNPSGFMYARSTYEKLAKIAEKFPNTWIISDEIYEYYAFDEEQLSLLDVAPNLKDRFIHVSGLSKGYFMTGWRVGYCAAADTGFIKLLRSLQSHSSTCLPGFIEAGAIKALELGRPLVEENLRTMAERRKLGKEILEKAGFSLIDPKGAFYFFIDVRDHLTRLRTDGLKIAERILNEANLALIPGEAFGYPGFLRLSYAQPEKVMRDGLERFTRFFARS